MSTEIPILNQFFDKLTTWINTLRVKVLKDEYNQTHLIECRGRRQNDATLKTLQYQPTVTLSAPWKELE